ncbi:Clp protease N-terminal domain-containing protein [Streptomyces sp. NPDC002018]|uniref:Clp protease N-terminal domain-containing protein n=1 Tax=Streptomyces sp. NPDC002018 TaxID=3364629 RepID=UPI0036C44BC6
MFERFSEGARAVVTGAVGHAERLDAGPVTDEHMLLALLDQEGTRASFAFASLGIRDRRASVEGALAQARRQGGLSKADTEALADLGIDVDRIVSAVEAAHGEGAMRAGAAGGGSGRWRPVRKGFSPAAKGALAKSLRIAAGRRDRRIDDAHILLALSARPGVVAEVLADHGATYLTLERAMFGGTGPSE